MKRSDLDKILAAGLITPDQHARIVEHFQVKEGGGRLLGVLSILGAVLVGGGVIQLIAANWDAIPHLVKIAAGLVLMLGAHAGGWWLREHQQEHYKTGEALHFLGALLFLANIALIGQTYHLSSRTPNAFLFWWAGIAALPWILRSKALHVLSLVAFGVWFGFELNENGSPIYFGHLELQCVLFALLGLIYLCAGHCLRGTRFAEFAPASEKLGVFLLLAFSYPMTWDTGAVNGSEAAGMCQWVLPAMIVGVLALAAAGLPRFKDLDPHWRWVWGLSIAALAGILAGQVYAADPTASTVQGAGEYHWFTTLALFIFALIQVQTGVQIRCEFLINVAVVFLGLDIFGVYVGLFRTMALTGWVFVLGGILLLALGVGLERQRRRWMQRIKTPPPGSSVPVAQPSP